METYQVYTSGDDVRYYEAEEDEDAIAAFLSDTGKADRDGVFIDIVVSFAGEMVPFDNLLDLMDKDIEEDLREKRGFWTHSSQAFIDAYCAVHLERHGEEFVERVNSADDDKLH